MPNTIYHQRNATSYTLGWQGAKRKVWRYGSVELSSIPRIQSLEQGVGHYNNKGGQRLVKNEPSDIAGENVK